MTTNKESQNNSGVKPNTANNGDKKVVVPFASVSTEKKDEQPAPAVPKVLTLQEYKDRAVSAFLLQKKHNELTAKRRELDEFSISSDRETCKIFVKDGMGRDFESGCKKSMKKLIEFWKEEFTNAINEVENEIKGIFGVEQEQAEVQPQISKAA